MFELSADADEIRVSQSGNVRESTVGVVVASSRRKSDSTLEISVYRGVLPSRTRLVGSESSSGGDQSLRISADLLRGRQSSAMELVANRWQVHIQRSSLDDVRSHGVLSTKLGRSQHGGPDRSDPRRIPWENIGERFLRVSAIGIIISRSALISRCSQEGDAASSDLVEFDIRAKDILLRGGVRAGDDLALSVIGPSPRHGDDVGSRSTSEEVLSEFHHPLIDGPEPDVRATADSASILDVQGRFGIRLRADVRADDFRDVDGGLRGLRGEGDEIFLIVRGIVLEFREAERRVRFGDVERVGDVVQLADEIGIDVSGGIVVLDLSPGISIGIGLKRQFGEADDEIDDVGELRGNGIIPTDDGAASVFLLDVVIEIRVKEIVEGLDGRLEEDGVTTIFDLANAFVGSKPGKDGGDVFRGRSDDIEDFVDRKPLAVIRRIRIGNV